MRKNNKKYLEKFMKIYAENGIEELQRVITIVVVSKNTRILPSCLSLIFCKMEHKVKFFD